MTPFHHLPLHAALAAGLLIAGTATLAATPITSDSFAPDWQSHTQALIRNQPVRNLTSYAWYVPDVLPPGKYVLINRTGDKVELIDGYTIDVRPGQTMRDVHVVVPAGYGGVEAMPASYVPDVASQRQPSEGR